MPPLLHMDLIVFLPGPPPRVPGVPGPGAVQAAADREDLTVPLGQDRVLTRPGAHAAPS